MNDPALIDEQILKSDDAMNVEITAFGAWMVGIGSIIGSFAWLIHGSMLARSGCMACIVAWLIAAAATAPLAFILMELSSMFPKAGGPYLYKYYALTRLIPGKGELIGFLTGWLFWICVIVGLAAMANGLVNLLSSVVFASVDVPLWFGPAVILLLFGSTTALNLFPIGKASQINNAFTIMKLTMAAAFVVLVSSSGHASIERVWQWSNPAGGTNFWGNVNHVLMLALAGFAYIEASGCTSAETANARRVVPRAMILTLFSVALIYITMCMAVAAAFNYVLTADGSTLVVAGSKVKATIPDLAGLLGGSLVGRLFTLGVVASIVGCAFVALMAMARVSYSMARTNLFPQQFARLDSNTKVPRFALWFQLWCLCGIAMAANLLARTGLFVDAYTFLGETFGFIYAFVAALYGVCLISLRYTDPQLERAFRIGGKSNLLAWVLVTMTVAVWGFSALFCVNWMHQAAGVLLMLSGIPIYHHYRKRST